MQLFGLVNSMLANDRTTAERDLSIARYAVIPLSPNSGLIGWVPNTDTLHALIRWVAFWGKQPNLSYYNLTINLMYLMYCSSHRMHLFSGTQPIISLENLTLHVQHTYHLCCEYPMSF